MKQIIEITVCVNNTVIIDKKFNVSPDTGGEVFIELINKVIKITKLGNYIK
jgi:hypothetical protein